MSVLRMRRSGNVKADSHGQWYQSDVENAGITTAPRWERVYGLRIACGMMSVLLILIIGVVWWPRCDHNHTTAEQWTSVYFAQWPELRVDAHGNFNLSAAIKDVYIDVGAHVWSEFINPVKQDPHKFALAFEPSRTNWAKQMANKGDTQQRFVLFNAAVSPDLGTAEFYDKDTALGESGQCNSLLRRRITHPRPGWKPSHNCLRAGEQAQSVPTFPLSAVLRRLPSRVTVRVLKIDAQGYDLRVLQSAGVHIRRAELVKTECQDLRSQDEHDELALYAGISTCQEIHEYMTEHGYMLIRDQWVNGDIREKDVTYSLITNTPTHK